MSVNDKYGDRFTKNSLSFLPVNKEINKDFSITPYYEKNISSTQKLQQID